MPSPNEYRRLDMESASAVATRGGSLGTTVKVISIGGAVAVAGLLLYSGLTPKAPRSMTDKAGDEFTTTPFPGPQVEARPQLDPGLIVVPPAPEPVAPPAPVPPPATIAAPPPPVAPIMPARAAHDDDAEARRLAELERQRLAEEERRRWERLRAGQMVNDAGGTGTGGTGMTLEEAKAANEAGGAVVQEDDPNRRFLAQASRGKVDVSKATRNERIDALVAQGTLIPGVLETALQSDLPGMVRAVTSQDVWSFDGRRVLIPMGTRLIGEYKSGLATGQTRVFIVWTRMLRPDGVSVDLGSIGADELGRAGMTGFVDKHYLEKFGSSVMLSLVGGAAQFISGLGQRNNGQTTTVSTYDPVTGQTTQTQSQANQSVMQARQIGAQQIAQSLTNIAQEALKDSIKIPPTIYVDQGAPIIVFVKRDLDFSGLYPDPVKEALRELKRERRAANGLSR